MLRERGCDPGMGDLQQCGPAGAEKDRRFAIDVPGDRAWAEETFPRRTRLLGNRGNLLLVLFAGDVLPVWSAGGQILLTGLAQNDPFLRRLCIEGRDA